MTSNEKFEIRPSVKFGQHMDDTPSSTFERIKLTKGENSVSGSVVLGGTKDVEDEITEREGR